MVLDLVAVAVVIAVAAAAAVANKRQVLPLLRLLDRTFDIQNPSNESS